MEMHTKMSNKKNEKEIISRYASMQRRTSEAMIQNECDKKEKIVKQLYMSQGKVTELVEAGYTVTIRPVKEGLKVTYHKEKVVK